MSNSQTDQFKSESIVIPPIEDKDFPSLYQGADKAAIQMQRICFCFRLWHLVFLILGSGVGAIATMIPEDFTAWFYVSMVIILLIGFVINIVARVLKYDEKWFNCRAIAESVKTATWRFMMKATPFEEDDLCEKTFISKISEIKNHKQSALRTLTPYQDSEAPFISNFMRNVRSKNTEERRNHYLKSRLSDQKTWYTKKASYNTKLADRWFYATTGLQFLAIVLAIIQAAGTTIPLNLVPILMTCATAAIAWSQMKRHGELAQSYSIAAQELGELEARFSSSTQESDFCQLVNDVEYAISREHTMWCVRREVIINQNSID